MLSVVIWSLICLALAGTILFLVLRTRRRMQPPASSREIMQAAREALRDKKNKPKIYRCCPDSRQEDLVAFHEIDKLRSDCSGKFRLKWDHLELKYIYTEHTEEMRLQLAGSKEPLTLFYVDGSLGSMAMHGETYDAEKFEMSQSGNLAQQLRRCLKHHLKQRGGSLDIQKYSDPSFSPKLDVNEAGEIKLKELPPKPVSKVPVTWDQPKEAS
ncbi:MAG TPA: hypothetical protein PKD72_01620 [Gemmatales bacterium]|nr:hypothetical protein [Gemmatales bacterium]